MQDLFTRFRNILNSVTGNDDTVINVDNNTTTTTTTVATPTVIKDRNNTLKRTRSELDESGLGSRMAKFKINLKPASSFWKDESNDDPPLMKKYRTVSSHFPKIMPSEDEDWNVFHHVTDTSRVRYIPIQREDQVPGTSAASLQNRPTHTPKHTTDRFYTRPSLLVESSRHEPRKNLKYQHASGKSKQYILLDDSRQSERQVLKPNREMYLKRVPIINIDDDDDDEDREDDDEDSEVCISDDDQHVTTNKVYQCRNNKYDIIDLSTPEDYDVIYVNKNVKPRRSLDSQSTQRIIVNESSSIFPASEPRPSQFRIFRSKNNEPFKAPINLNKIKKKKPSVWNNPRTYMSQAKKTSIAECFRLEEKKKYEDLIKLSSSSFTSKAVTAKSERYDLTTIKNMLEKLNRNKSFSEDLKVNGTDDKHEYAPITIASINLSDSEPEVITSADDASTTSSIRIAPVNSLKQQMKDKPVANSNWIDDIMAKYKSKQNRRAKEIEEQTLENDLITKLNLDQWRSKIVRHAKSNITIPIDLIEELEDEEVFPELTEQQEHIIQNALSKHMRKDQILISKFNLNITRNDILTLDNLNWLNDEVINFYVNLLMERSQSKDDLPKVYGMNTFFYPKLMQAGHSALKRWTRKVDIFSHDLLVVPVHLGVHWCMSIVDFRNKTVRYYDSMGGNNMACCNALLKYLEEESMDKKREKYDTSEWKKEVMKSIPQQMNGSDCGVFSCTFAEFISRNASISFSQNDMPYIRRKMVLEIVQGQLIT